MADASCRHEQFIGVDGSSARLVVEKADWIRFQHQALAPKISCASLLLKTIRCLPMR
jgi:hypothetical protein